MIGASPLFSSLFVVQLENLQKAHILITWLHNNLVQKIQIVRYFFVFQTRAEVVDFAV
jgi:hypothetical protein